MQKGIRESIADKWAIAAKLWASCTELEAKNCKTCHSSCIYILMIPKILKA